MTKKVHFDFLLKIYHFITSFIILYFPGSKVYWEKRYRIGGNSGQGSYDRLSEFKADVLKKFIKEKNIKSVIEFGCGDGNQLSLIDYPSYTGFDISSSAISICRKRFSGDRSKTFRLIEKYNGETADVTLSLDVIFHLVEDDIFTSYMEKLFDSSNRYVIIYSSNSHKNSIFQSAHLKHRKFSDWIHDNRPNWNLINNIPNKYPSKSLLKIGSFSDFYFYEKNNL